MNRRVQGLYCQRYAGNPLFHLHDKCDDKYEDKYENKYEDNLVVASVDNADTHGTVRGKPRSELCADLRKDVREDLRKEVREDLRKKRNALSAAQQSKAAEALIASVTALPQWNAAKSIALYSPFEGEIGTLPLAEHARSVAKRVHLPVITENKTLAFALWDETTTLDKNRFGILQPKEDAELQLPESLDIIFMPLVGWDTAGNRLGMGGGFYDRTLEQESTCLKVGLAHHCQQVKSIEPAHWDVAMDYVATDNRLYACAAPDK